MAPYRTIDLGRFPFRRGGELPSLTLAYETWGTLAPAKDNAILLATGLSPGSHAASTPENPAPGWWEAMIGPGKALDTNRHFVICFNSPGSCRGSTGPASVNPATGAPWRLSFPAVTVEEIATAGRALTRALGIERLHAVVGNSLGGMVSLAHAILFPGEAARLVSISAAAASGPFAIALRALQREAICRDPDWKGGDYPPERTPVNGMILARKLGMLTYRGLQEWDEKFGRHRKQGADAGALYGEFEVEGYLQYQAEKFAGQHGAGGPALDDSGATAGLDPAQSAFDANCYLYLSRAMDWFDAAEHGGGDLIAALKRIAARSLVIGVESDLLFPVRQQAALAEALREAGREVVYHHFPSVHGHDSFLVDINRFTPPLREFLDSP